MGQAEGPLVETRRAYDLGVWGWCLSQRRSRMLINVNSPIHELSWQSVTRIVKLENSELSESPR
jgi:hypothetical protein